MTATRSRRRTALADPTIEVETITPEIAGKWLDANTHNRPLNEKWIAELRGRIRRGEWQFNGDAIRFGADGTLQDGQHRLWAILLEEIEVDNVVVRNLPPGAQLTIDMGRRRSLADELRMEGYPNAVRLASTINIKWRLDNGLIRTGQAPSLPMALDVLKKNPDLVEAGRMHARLATRFAGTSAGIGVLYHEFASRDAEAADTFFEKLVQGLGLKKGDPVFALRRHLETNKTGAIMQMALVIKAWNAYVEGKSVDMLSWRPVGKAAEGFPEIKG